MPSQWPDDLDLALACEQTGAASSFAIPPAAGNESAGRGREGGGIAGGEGGGAGKGGGGPSRGALVSGGPNGPDGRGRKGFGRSMSTSNLGGWTSGASPSVAIGYQSESEKSDTSQSGTESEDGVEGGQRDGERLEDGGESEDGGGGAAACESRSKHKKKKGRERKKENARKKTAAAFVERTVGTVPPQLKRCVRLWVGGFCSPSISF